MACYFSIPLTHIYIKLNNQLWQSMILTWETESTLDLWPIPSVTAAWQAEEEERLEKEFKRKRRAGMQKKKQYHHQRIAQGKKRKSQ